jgi:Lipid A 3-O-deacylase (PagL)
MSTSIPKWWWRLRFLSASAALLDIALATSPVACCQDSPLLQGRNEFGAWGGYSLGSPHVYGTLGHGQLGVLAFRYGRTLFVSRKATIEYTIDILPAEIVRQPVYTSCERQPQDAHMPIRCKQASEIVYGGGMSPFGWKFNFRKQRRLQIFGAASGGFVASARPIPIDVPGDDQFNFTFDFQVGFEHFNVVRNRAWVLGYKVQHISNGYRGSINPGIDLSVLFLGYSFFK